MKKIILIFFILIINCNLSIAANEEVIDSQKDAFGINDFLKSAKEYGGDEFDDINYDELFKESISGNVNTNFIFSKGWNILGSELKSGINMLGTILVIIVIHSILKSVVESLGNEDTGKIAYFVQFILIVVILMKSYSEILKNINETITMLTDFTYILMPLLITIMTATGNFVSGGVIQPLILFAITFIGKFIVSIIFPILIVSTVLGIVSNLSDKIQVEKLSKYFKSTIVWVLCIVLTIFTGILSLETSLTKGVDQISAKTTKAAISSFVPVVGKILGDTVETVFGCAGIIKNAVGFVGVIGVVSICILPVIRVGILTLTYYLASGFCEIIADKKIVNILEQMGDTFKILFGILTSISLMMIIAISIMMKISVGT